MGSRNLLLSIDLYIPSNTSMIISGGARGIDTVAEEFADKKRISKLILRPNYTKYGRKAPLIRNKQIVDLADYILAIWDGKSRGTYFTINYAKEQNKPIQIVIADKLENPHD